MTDDERSAVLLSVRSPHVERLLAGTKTVELRRRPVNLRPGTLVLLYASGLRKEIVGSVEVTAVESAHPATLWRRHRTSVGLGRTEFDAYFDGASVGYAVLMSQPRALPDPISLEELRQRWKSFTTPQTYRRLGRREIASILNGERQLLGA